MITTEDIFIYSPLNVKQEIVATFGKWMAERKEGNAILDLYMMDYFLAEVVQDIATGDIREIRIADLWKAIPQYGLKLKVTQRERQTG